AHGQDELLLVGTGARAVRAHAVEVDAVAVPPRPRDAALTQPPPRNDQSPAGFVVCGAGVRTGVVLVSVVFRRPLARRRWGPTLRRWRRGRPGSARRGCVRRWGRGAIRRGRGTRRSA